MEEKDAKSKEMAKRHKKTHAQEEGEEPKPGASVVAPTTALEPGAAAMTTRAAAEQAKAVELHAAATTAKATEEALDKKVQRAAEPPASKPAAASTTATDSASERDIQQKINAQTVSSKKMRGDDDETEKDQGQHGDDEAKKKDGSKDLKAADKSSELMDKDIEAADNEVQTEINHGRTQGPSVVAAAHGTAKDSTAKDKDKEDEKELAVAVLVEEDRQVVDAKADIYDREPKPFYTRPIFWIFIVGLVIIVGVVVGVTVAVVGGDDDDGPTVAPTDSPTASPTEAPTREGVSILSQRLQEYMGPDLHLSSSVAFESAVEWFFDDPNKYTNITFIGVDETTRRSLQEDGAPKMLNIQRFVLAWLWFHTTANGQEPWLSCNPPGVPDAHNGDVGGNTCTFLFLTVLERPAQEVYLCYTEAPEFPRWLTPASECTWPGVYCNDYADNTIVEELDLLGVGVRGTFPSFLQLIPGFGRIAMTYGALSGTFPDDMNGFRDLFDLTVLGNLLEGPIPDTFYELPIEVLNVAYNRFSGALPDKLGAFPEMKGLYLMENAFEGPLPESISDLSETLLYLRLENNDLAGWSLPESWGSLTNLRELRLYENGLVGTVPQEWNNMTAMTNFRLYQNDLEGPLPPMDWPNLQFVFIQNNRFTGTFPESFYTNSNLQFIHMANNKFSGRLEERFNETPGLNSLLSFEVAGNEFTGPIPESLDGLDAIRVIRMYYNNFTGVVPGGICVLRGPDDLVLLEADCAGNPVANECECCTLCCDREFELCRPVDGRFLSPGDSDPDQDEEEDIRYAHQRVIPRKRKLQTRPICEGSSAVYRWDADTGLLINFKTEGGA
uniref:L domain-like protein n=1 Tax=Amphora coffeiformis TaxID=265554 RepID=A0A7S3P463_9STRA|eukprot:scaffold703_cov168-Amphora_coffeaeformis.AAC.10